MSWGLGISLKASVTEQMLVCHPPATSLPNALLLIGSRGAVKGLRALSSSVPHILQAIAMHSDCIFKKEQAMCLERIQRANDLMGLNESSPGEAVHSLGVLSTHRLGMKECWKGVKLCRKPLRPQCSISAILGDIRWLSLCQSELGCSGWLKGATLFSWVWSG